MDKEIFLEKIKNTKKKQEDRKRFNLKTQFKQEDGFTLPERLPLYRGVLDMSTYLASILDSIKRSLRYSIGNEAMKSCATLLSLICDANRAAKNLELRKSKLEDLVNEVDKLSSYLSILINSKQFSNKQVSVIYEKLEDIRKQLYGWKNSTDRKI